MLLVNRSKSGEGALHDKDLIDEGYPAAAVRLPARLDELARRIFDLVAATMCLMLFAPILLLTSIAIKLDFAAQSHPRDAVRIQEPSD